MREIDYLPLRQKTSRTMRDRQFNRSLLSVIHFMVISLFSGTAIQAAQPTSMPSTAVAPQTIRYLLFLLVVLAGIFLVSSFAFLRWSRRYRSHIFREPSQPTASEDAWSMHQLPPDGENDNASEQPHKKDEPEE